MLDQNSSAPVRILRMKALQDRVGLGRSSIYNRMNPASPQYDHTFPKPISLGGTAIGWVESQVTEWINSRAYIKESEPTPRSRDYQDRTGGSVSRGAGDLI